MDKGIPSILQNKRILTLGFGKEGISTYKLLMRIVSPEYIAIADQDEGLLTKIDFEIHPHCQLYLGKDYLGNLNAYDIIIKSPGISTLLLNGKDLNDKISSQSKLFLNVYADRTIGITGTKGKSTTSSLISHILSSFYKDVLLLGNIGIPPFDMIDRIGPETRIVFELSSHQLEHISISPFVAILLNLYEEHLDHYESYSNYQLAKFNITKFQKEDNWFIMNGDNLLLMDLFQQSNLKRKLLTFSHNKIVGDGAFIDENGEIVSCFQGKTSRFDFIKRQYLPGDHNLINIMAAICASKIMGVPDDLIDKSIKGFKGLKNRLEYIGEFKGISFYNDSISTIPQSTIQAVLSLKKVDTLILGGKDRGIDYQPLVDFLPGSGVRILIFIGEAGKRILEGLEKSSPDRTQKWFVIKSFNEISDIVRSHTQQGFICLLSPAAASYDLFRNFEERGEVFKKIAENL
jgi:UDP-N-acetylmuramoylalanine--D-glutamate ligase